VSIRHFGTSADMSGQFGTSAEVSYGHFGTSAEMSWGRSVLGPKCLDTHGNRHIKRAKVPGNESSIELSFPGAKRLGSERARERKFQGAKV